MTTFECYFVQLERGVTPFTDFVRDESGATAIEYGLIAALISLAISVGVLGNNLNKKFNSIADKLK